MTLVIACVQVENYCGNGAGYVNALFNAVRQHVTIPHRFVCLTDDKTGLDERIETITPPSDLRGWWVKLFLFSPGLFKNTDRILFIDLDTIILKNIDDIASYDGPFAGLGNFRNARDPFSSCIMAWPNGAMPQLWKLWNDLGRPVTRWGDDEFIRNANQYTVKLNRVFPGIKSYKFHKCHVAPPADARVIIFVAKPKPHELTGTAWVREAWRPQLET